MSNDPLSIPEWKHRASSDPIQTARALAQAIERIPIDLRQRVFSHTLGLPHLESNFQRAAEQPDLPLAGVPYLLKDLYDFPGIPTTASSAFLTEVRPTPTQESALSQQTRERGGVFAGKTHLNEFAYGLSGENLHFGNCPHPRFPERLSGGSSSGSAWAVARGIVPIAFGTDTGGSIRVPAAWCGLYGLRLSPNAWSKNGCVPLAPSFDTAGWFCASASDMALSIEALLKIKIAKPNGEPLRGLSLLDTVVEMPDDFSNAAFNLAERISAEPMPEATEEYAMASQSVAKRYSVLQSIEALEVHKAWLDPYKDRYDPVVWQRIDRARHWTADAIEDAQNGERAIRAFFESAFAQYDFVVLPATQSPAISAAQHTDAFRSELLGLTAPGSFARCPALTIPIHNAQGESMGLQVLYKDERADIPLRILKAIGR